MSHHPRRHEGDPLSRDELASSSSSSSSTSSPSSSTSALAPKPRTRPGKRRLEQSGELVPATHAAVNHEDGEQQHAVFREIDPRDDPTNRGFEKQAVVVEEKSARQHQQQQQLAATETGWRGC